MNIKIHTNLLKHYKHFEQYKLHKKIKKKQKLYCKLITKY